MRDTEIGYELIPLEEGPHLEQAREWAKMRRVYIENDLKVAPHIKHIGVFCQPLYRYQDLTLICVISIETTGPDEYLMDVTSPRRSKPAVIIDATYRTGFQLFRDLKARLIWTKCPTVNGHLHRGSKALCEACGLTPKGPIDEPEEVNGRVYQWQRYQLTRMDWLRYHQAVAA